MTLPGTLRLPFAIACAALMLALAISLGVTSDPGVSSSVDWDFGWRALSALGVLAASVAWAIGTIRRPSTSALTVSYLLIPAYWAYLVSADVSGQGSLLADTGETSWLTDAFSAAFLLLFATSWAGLIGGALGLIAHLAYSAVAWMTEHFVKPADA